MLPLVEGLVGEAAEPIGLAVQGPDSVLAAAVGRDFKVKLSPLLYLIAIPSAYIREWIAGTLYVIVALMCYAGEVEDGEKALAPFRVLAEPVVDMLRTMPYREIYPPEEAGFHPTAVLRTMFVDAIDHAAAVTIVERLEASTAQMPVTQIRVLGGAMARVPNDATAFAHRDDGSW